MNQIALRESQTVVDIAMQHYGDARAVLFLLADNPGTFTLRNPWLPVGTLLNVRAREQWQNAPGTNVRIAESFLRTRTKASNGAEQPGGIGHILIGTSVIGERDTQNY